MKCCPVTIDRCGAGSRGARVVEVYRASDGDALHEVSVYYRDDLKHVVFQIKSCY